jgi:hypothetical protein
MKIWTEYGSEHSMNLVLIGKFKQVREAEKIERLLEKLWKRVAENDVSSIPYSSPEFQRFSDEMLSLLRSYELYTLSPAELEQFNFEHNLDREGARITITTDEADVSAFIKVFVEAGARVEVYSAHSNPEDLADES